MNLVLDKIGFLINKENILLLSFGRNKKRRKERKGEGGRKKGNIYLSLQNSLERNGNMTVPFRKYMPDCFLLTTVA